MALDLQLKIMAAPDDPATQVMRRQLAEYNSLLRGDIKKPNSRPHAQPLSHPKSV
jgi:hypothetical protein